MSQEEQMLQDAASSHRRKVEYYYLQSFIIYSLSVSLSSLPWRYDKLLWSYRRPGQSTGHPRASVVGVTVRSDVLMTYALNAYTRDSVS